jgi:hypothetical protein
LRIPLLLPVIGYLALAVLLALTVGEARTAEILGFSAERGDAASSIRLALRVAVVVPTGMAVFLLTVWAQGRRRRGPRVVPSRH